MKTGKHFGVSFIKYDIYVNCFSIAQDHQWSKKFWKHYQRQETQLFISKIEEESDNFLCISWQLTMFLVIC